LKQLRRGNATFSIENHVSLPNTTTERHTVELEVKLQVFFILALKSCLCRKLNPGRPPRSQSLYCMMYFKIQI